MASIDSPAPDQPTNPSGEEEVSRETPVDGKPGALAEDEAPTAREAQDEILIEALASGMAYPDAGKLVGVVGRTVSRRMDDTDFRARVSRRRGERVTQVTGALTDMSSEALQVLRDCMAEGRAADRLRAAQMVLIMMSRLRHETEIEDRLANVERLLHEGGTN
jgi:hypothetical protein